MPRLPVKIQWLKGSQTGNLETFVNVNALCPADRFHIMSVSHQESGNPAHQNILDRSLRLPFAGASSALQASGLPVSVRWLLLSVPSAGRWRSSHQGPVQWITPWLMDC